jgi:hypothetical protein
VTTVGFWFDPVCPFCWITSKWLRMVAAGQDLSVDWQFISLRLLNRDVDYASHFPPDYEQGHTAGLRLLRVAAAVREGEGPAGVDALQLAYGETIFESAPGQVDRSPQAERPLVERMLADAGLPVSYADALDDDTRDELIQAETDRALELTGKDVGTPILQVDPPHGPALFGPVISRLPEPDEAVELWQHVTALARFPGFAELKRSLREAPQLPALGYAPGTEAEVEDWQQGRRAKA